MIGMKYLFWNTHKNIDINPILRDLITENCISIVVLAEYTADINDLIRSMINPTQKVTSDHTENFLHSNTEHPQQTYLFRDKERIYR